MAKPDKPGFWKERNRAYLPMLVWKDRGRLVYSAVNDSGLVKPDGFDIEGIPGDDWLPFAEPEFPELPPKPSMVYAHHKYAPRDWWMSCSRGFRRQSDGTQGAAENLTVIPHPDNDPEAVRLIEEARR